MNAKLKALWLEALRSGEFRQARGTLKDESGAYCCLGVLAHVAASAGMLGSMTEVNENDHGMTVAFTDEEGSWGDDDELPENCFGLSLSVINQCMARNDGKVDPFEERQTFAQIADYIEAELSTEAR